MNATLNAKQQRIAKTSTVGGQPIPVKPSGYADREGLNQQLNAQLKDNAEARLHTLFPFSSADPEDAKWALREQYLTRQGHTIPGIGEVIAPPEYFDYCQRKYNQQLADELKDFIFSQIDLNNPASREWWTQRFPEYVQEFENAWEMQLEYQKRLGLIQIKGVQDMSDMWYLFCKKLGLDQFATQYRGQVPQANKVPATFTGFQHIKNPEIPSGGRLGRLTDAAHPVLPAENQFGQLRGTRQPEGSIPSQTPNQAPKFSARARQ